MMKPISAFFLALAVGILPATVAAHSPGDTSHGRTVAALSQEERFAAQAVIERFWYEHRIWPKENPAAKPPFEQMTPASLIQARADDALKKSAALNKFWGVEITREMLQAEMNRMARDTKDSAALMELFTRLGNDPNLIAETLARGLLADRLIRQKYAFDSHLHAGARAQAENIALNPGVDWHSLRGTYSHQVTVPETGINHENADAAGPERRLSETEFERTVAETPSVGEIAPVDEQPTGFLLKRTLSRSPQRIEIEKIWVPKVGFNEWWEPVAKGFAFSENEARTNGYVYRMPDIVDTSGCNEWSSMNVANGPNAYTGWSVTVWTGAEMIVWGWFNLGGRYNPALDNWTPTTSTGYPQPRERETGVWTGTELIVWGGDLYTGDYLFYNSGGRYNPSSDIWSPTSTGANAPGARTVHTAVWTGSLMIIAGGWHCDTFRCNGGTIGYKDVGRYNPWSDSWLPLSTNASAWKQPAVWTGTVMLDKGYDWAAYNPALDIWTAVAKPDPPISTAVAYSAIWSGHEMILWGGGIPFGLSNGGGQYDPALDRWLATSVTVLTPSPRANHSAIWTGNEMIIWGGDKGNNGFTDDGGRYNPDNRAWQPTSLAGAPSPRREHLSVWTGSRMIIWGGTGSTGDQNSGGIYASGSVPSPGDKLRLSKSFVISLNWSTVYGAGSYNVKRSDLATALFPFIPTTIVSTPTIPQYSEPDDGQSHFYAVEAVNQCGATP